MPTVLGAMHPAIEWREAEGSPLLPSGEALIGPDAVLNNLFVRLATEWDGFAVHPKTYYDAGDTVVVEVRCTGTYKSTGTSMDWQATHIWAIEDGKLRRFQQYVDTWKLQDVMGVRPSP